MRLLRVERSVVPVLMAAAWRMRGSVAGDGGDGSAAEDHLIITVELF